MTHPEITPEMIAAWRTLQAWARDIKSEMYPSEADRQAADAIDVLDNSDFMVPIERAEKFCDVAHHAHPDGKGRVSTCRLDGDDQQHAEEQEEPVHVCSIPLSELNADGLSRAFQKNRKQR